MPLSHLRPRFVEQYFVPTIYPKLHGYMWDTFSQPSTDVGAPLTRASGGVVAMMFAVPNCITKYRRAGEMMR
jgi:hypothetical protein